MSVYVDDVKRNNNRRHSLETSWDVAKAVSRWVEEIEGISKLD